MRHLSSSKKILIKSKVRGLRRKCNLMVERINELTETFPVEDSADCRYWHMHLPVSRSFIDSINTPRSVRKLCMQTLIDRVEHLFTIKPKIKIPTRVVASISLPNIFDSQIIVFFGNEYYGDFFSRNTDEQRWILWSEQNSLIDDWGLNCPDSLSERVYSEQIRDKDFFHQGIIWFVGELE